MSGNLTLKDIAHAAGVSEMTASRALRNAVDVSPITRKKVIKTAKKLGYIPNRIAGALASNKVNLVGVVIPSVKSYVFSEVLDGISFALKPTRLRPLFGLTEYDLDTEEEMIRDMLAWRPAGLIVAGLEHTKGAKKILCDMDIPLVEIMDVDGEAIDSNVGISHYRAGMEMAEAITTKGHSKIGFLGTKMTLDFRAAKRFNGFVDGLKSKGLKLIDQELYSTGSTIQKGKESTRAMLERNPSLDCIYCSTDIIAIGAVMHCIDARISIPNQLGIAGFNHLGMASGLPIELATTDSLRFEIGKTAASLILKRNEPNANSAPKRIEFTPSVKLGNSI